MNCCKSRCNWECATSSNLVTDGNNKAIKTDPTLTFFWMLQSRSGGPTLLAPWKRFHPPAWLPQCQPPVFGETLGWFGFLQVFSISHIDNINKVNSVSVTEFGNKVDGGRDKCCILRYLPFQNCWLFSAERLFIMFPIHFEKLGAILTIVIEMKSINEKIFTPKF